MRANVECKVLHLTLTLIANKAQGRRNRQGHRGILASKNAILEDRIADQLGTPYSVFHRASLLLRNNNLGVFQDGVRDNIGIRPFLITEVDQEVLFGRSGDREHLTMRLLGIVINGMLYVFLNRARAILLCRYRMTVMQRY